MPLNSVNETEGTGQRQTEVEKRAAGGTPPQSEPADGNNAPRVAPELDAVAAQNQNGEASEAPGTADQRADTRPDGPPHHETKVTIVGDDELAFVNPSLEVNHHALGSSLVEDDHLLLAEIPLADDQTVTSKHNGDHRDQPP